MTSTASAGASRAGRSLTFHVVHIGWGSEGHNIRQLALEHPGRHRVVDDPDRADIILFAGLLVHTYRDVLHHELYRRYPEKCAVFSDDDEFLPLLPGVYCSSRRSISTRIGRVRTHGYIPVPNPVDNPPAYELAMQDHLRPVERDLLFSFIGNPSPRLRRTLIQRFGARPDAVLAAPTAGYDHQKPRWEGLTLSEREQADRAENQHRYVDVLRRSHFGLCPKGHGSATFRLFETMSLGVAPVLMSNRYVLPEGPDWGFLVRVSEHRVGRLPAVLESLKAESASRGEEARRCWQEWYAPDVTVDRLIDAVDQAMNASPAIERFYRAGSALLIAGYTVRWRLRLLLILRARQLLSRLSPLFRRGRDAR